MRSLTQAPFERLADLLAHSDSLETRESALRLLADLEGHLRANQAMWENAPEPVFVLDVRGLVRDANSLACALVGRTREELAGLDPRQLAPLEDRVFSLFDIDPVDPGKPFRRERRVQRKDGAVLWCEVSTTRLGDGTRLAFVRDITAQRRLAENLRSNELRLQALVSAVDEIVYEIDGGGAIINVWAKDTALLMRPRAELIGRMLSDLFSEPQTQQFMSAIRRVLNTGQPENLEYPLHLNGSEHWFQARVAPVSSANSFVKTVCLVARDVTERYQAELALSATAAEVSALYRATAGLLSAAGDTDKLVQGIAQALAAELAPVCCALYLPDGDGTLTCKARAGDFDAEYGTVTSGGPGLIALSYDTGETVYASNVDTDPRYLPGDPRTRSEFTTPLRGTAAKGSANRDMVRGVIGVLDLQSPRVEAFSPRAQRMISVFAEQAGLALANAQLVSHLVEARAAAEEASRLKSEFLANTSHELRTPLTGILGALSLILNDEVQSPQEARQFAQIASDSAHNLLSIVNDLLDFARMEAGKMTVQLEPVELNALLTNLHMLMWASVTKKGLRLAMDLPPGLVWARADEEKVKQVMLNLLGNALKFTDQGEIRVLVEVEADQQRLRLSVSDTGIGIPPEKQGLLFRPFVQVDGSTTRRHGGTGLGLSISRRLAEMMGGALTLYSAGAGQGSTFTLTLPLAEDVP